MQKLDTIMMAFVAMSAITATTASAAHEAYSLKARQIGRHCGIGGVAFVKPLGCRLANQPREGVGA